MPSNAIGRCNGEDYTLYKWLKKLTTSTVAVGQIDLDALDAGGGIQALSFGGVQDRLADDKVLPAFQSCGENIWGNIKIF